MGIISTPNRGQPLDIDYIASIVGQLNTLTTLVNNDANVYSTLNDATVKTSSLKLFAKTFNVTAQTTNSTGDITDITVNYPAFNGFPVVTATIVSGTTNTVGDKATVVVRNVTTTSATLRVTYYQSGSLNINVNVIAIGQAQ